MFVFCVFVVESSLIQYHQQIQSILYLIRHACHRNACCGKTSNQSLASADFHHIWNLSEKLDCYTYTSQMHWIQHNSQSLVSTDFQHIWNLSQKSIGVHLHQRCKLIKHDSVAHTNYFLATLVALHFTPVSK